MRFFYPDSSDYLDPTYDLDNEISMPGRVPGRDDQYAHEFIHPERPYDGMLVSKYALDNGGSRFTQARRVRFHREGVRKFYRFPKRSGATHWDEPWPTLGDCGAFGYIKDDVPPYTAQEIVDFYDNCDFTYGVSVDHIIKDFKPELDEPSILKDPIPEDYQRRFDITLQLSDEFIRIWKAGDYAFHPVGIVQGWSPESYKRAVEELVKMGYDYIAIGGMAGKGKKGVVLRLLNHIKPAVNGKAGLHLFGVSALDQLPAFKAAGVISFDSTSPLKQAVHDNRNNYYSKNGHYLAIRVAMVDYHRGIRNMISSGALEQSHIQGLETKALSTVRAYGKGDARMDETLAALQEYEAAYGGISNWERVTRTLREKPWETCPCPVCKCSGIDVAILRTQNRNRRRAFHNMWYLQREVTNFRTSQSE